ncbi:DUF4386 domain-containing protein [Streptosporangium saharense]|uniref:DUF4386 domain-containing protein n=1 Tax=Streptosporangium saharense TaxID=1706840 RepID=A0A7W7VLD1_9ACTN|nr:DUF4386 domain-containing protein [Streptosporangium saharense]MBB4914264.1 hypothetical protein [Streptosporangium saharense]
MSVRTTGRAVGALFLLAFVVYMTGNALAGSGEAADQARTGAGALLMLANSAAVAGIGVLMFPVLRRHHELSAHVYLVSRVVEAVMLAVGVVFLLLLIPLARDASALPSLASVARQGNLYAYQIAMISLGLGSLMFCRVLFQARLVPRFMAIWGMVGYAVFATGAILEVLGYGVGVTLSIPGGLFEVALGVLLVAKGFPAEPSHDREEAAYL